jgi:two-component system sensor histidine kinase/response regulator
MLRLEISDTGIGIAPQAQARLFQSFTQADSSTTRKYGGTGLGLAISKRLVNLMGGEIGVRSELGQGSTFWFTLPLLAAEALAGSDAPSDPAASLQNLRVLVVDDQASDRQIAHRLLASWGLISDGASNAAEALKLLRYAAQLGHCYDLALIDYSMPGMDGIELAQTIRSEGDGQATRLILLSAHDRSEVFERALAAGFAACLAKPVRASVLFDALNAALPQPAADHGAAGAAQPAATRPLILLAEDNLTNQRLAQLQLAKMGYDVHTVGNGQEAVDALATDQRRDYSLILMDCQMPVLDGFAATAAIRQIKLARRIPIIAMTANAMQGDRERCLTAGMDDYISKPIHPERFKQLLLKWSPSAPAPATSARPEVERQKPATPARAPAQAQAQAPMLIDFSRLDDYFGDEPDVISSLLAMFCSSAGPLLEQLGAAIESHDTAGAVALAHEVKGTCGNLGVDSMAQLAREIEALVEGADWLRSAERLEAARQVFAQVLVLIREHDGA